MNNISICKTCTWFAYGACRNNQKICIDNSEYLNDAEVNEVIIQASEVILHDLMSEYRRLSDQLQELNEEGYINET